MYFIETKEAAYEMIENAFEWCEEQQPKLGEAFKVELESVYHKLAEHPEYYSLATKRYRQIKMPRFPYVLFYEIIKNSVIIYAVFHTSRNPKDKRPKK